MSQPFHLAAVPRENWQKQFEAACDERAWSAAAQLLAGRPRDFPAMVTLNAFPTTVAEFVTEAPVYALKISQLPGSLEPTLTWRSAFIGELIREHLLCARGALGNRCLRLAHAHLVAALQLRPRSRSHEVIATAVLTEAALTVGQLESIIAAEHPDLESAPHVAAPHPDDYRRAVAEEYHPSFLPSLLSIAVEVGATTEFLDLGVRMVALHMHWPTWRALAAASSTAMYVLRVSARNVLRDEKGLSPGATAFLEALVKGRPFRQLPPTDRADDVEF